MCKTFTIFIFSILLFGGCDKAAQTQQTTANTNTSVMKNDGDSAIVSGHSQPQSNGVPPQKSQAKTKWTQSGSPIDTSKFDAEIERAQSALKTKPNDKAAVVAVADAFSKRATALTEAAQYASALGDYRRVLKFDAGNKEAETWINKILEIYASINREAPAPGEEPPPLPFDKNK